MLNLIRKIIQSILGINLDRKTENETIIQEPLQNIPSESEKESTPVKKSEETEQFKFTKNPLDKLEYTQKFGGWPEHYKQYNMKGHNGVDFRTRFDDSPDGKRSVHVVMDGKVLEAVKIDNNGYGKYVKLIHPDGSQTIYAHFDSLKVETNQQVKAGDILGISNNTGASTGAHLHFGYRPPKFDYNNGYKGYIDPEAFFV